MYLYVLHHHDIILSISHKEISHKYFINAIHKKTINISKKKIFWIPVSVAGLDVLIILFHVHTHQVEV